MIGLTLNDLQSRHAAIKAAREDAAREARERDMGYAYVLGELEQLIALVEARAQKGGDGDDNAA